VALFHWARLQTHHLRTSYHWHITPGRQNIRIQLAGRKKTLLHLISVHSRLGFSMKLPPCVAMLQSDTSTQGTQND